jgi:hypothetical protein
VNQLRSFWQKDKILYNYLKEQETQEHPMSWSGCLVGEWFKERRKLHHFQNDKLTQMAPIWTHRFWSQWCGRGAPLPQEGNARTHGSKFRFMVMWPWQSKHLSESPLIQT